MKRRAPAELDPPSQSSGPAPLPPDLTANRRASGHGPRTREEAETRYVAARDAWTLAMRTANSRRPADLASLALAQEAYEAAAAEREKWLTGRVAMPIEPAEARRNLEIAVGQEIAWRRIHDRPHGDGLLGRLRRRLGGK